LNPTHQQESLPAENTPNTPRSYNWWGATFTFFRRWPVFPAFVLIALVFGAIFAYQIAPYDPDAQSLRDRNTPPAWFTDGSTKYLLGTDHVGRDVLSRVIHGSRISLAVAGVSLASGLIVGVVLGLLAGWYGGKTDELITRLVDIWNALPFLLVALVVVSLFGGSLIVLMSVLAMVSWVGFVRTVRAEVFIVKNHDYVLVSMICGASTYHIFKRHLIPGVTHAILVVATLAVGGLILTEATLSFLGAGIPAPTPSWGLMVSEGRDYLTDAWWSSFWPGLAIFLTVMSLNFLGDWLRDYFDPKLRQLV
jgi:peptide/nickel transport system permease protein